MDIDELIRAELTAQADRAPDPHTVLAGVSGRARARRHRRVAAAAGLTAAAAVLAVAVPYAAVHRAAPLPAGSVPTAAPVGRMGPVPAPARFGAMGWEPGWLPAGLQEYERRLDTGAQERTYARGKTTVLMITVAKNDSLGIPPGQAVDVGGRSGTWIADPVQNNLFVRLPGNRTMTLLGSDANGITRAVAIRIAASVRDSDDTLEPAFRLPAGIGAETQRSVLLFDGGYDASVNVGVVRIVRAHLAPRPLTRTDHAEPVTIAGRPGWWVPAQGSQESSLDTTLPGGDSFGVAAAPTKEIAVMIAEGTTELPATYDW